MIMDKSGAKGSKIKEEFIKIQNIIQNPRIILSDVSSNGIKMMRNSIKYRKDNSIYLIFFLVSVLSAENFIWNKDYSIYA